VVEKYTMSAKFFPMPLMQVPETTYMLDILESLIGTGFA
jgi:hypothetical protein